MSRQDLLYEDQGGKRIQRIEHQVRVELVAQHLIARVRRAQLRAREPQLTVRQSAAVRVL